jgi:large subunit ribosomal protein L23
MGLFDRLKQFKSKKDTDKQKELKSKKAEEKPAADNQPLKLKSEAATALKPKEAKVDKKKKDDTKDAYKIFVKPLVTEKSTHLASLNKYCFSVAKNANKVMVKKAIKDLYGVEPIDVNIINNRRRWVKYGRVEGRKSSWKKAIVTLKQGDKIEIYEGV